MYTISSDLGVPSIFKYRIDLNNNNNNKFLFVNIHDRYIFNYLLKTNIKFIEIIWVKYIHLNYNTKYEPKTKKTISINQVSQHMNKVMYNLYY